MIAYYDHKPPRVEAMGNGKYFYRWDIEEVGLPEDMIGINQSEDVNEPTQKELDSVIVSEATAMEEINAEDVTMENVDSVEEEHNPSMWKCKEVVFLPPMSVNNITSLVANEEGVELGSEDYATIRNEVGLAIIPLDFEAAKKELEEKIWDYDKQTEEFFIGGVSVWLNREERQTILRRCDAEEAKGLETVVLRKNGMKFELPIATCRGIVLEVEFYASRCYDNREDLLVAKDELTTAEGVLAFDWTSGYPEKLEF